jgi:hypothetical protein
MIVGDGHQHVIASFESDFTRDAFGKLRVSQPFPAFSSKAEYSKNRHTWWEVNEAGAQVNEAIQSGADSTISLPIPAIAGRSLIRQTRSWFPYQPGNSHRPLLTFAMRANEPGIRKRIGLFSEKNGIFFEQGSDGIYYIVLRSSSSGTIQERKIPQTEWNLDTFISTGIRNPSGINEETIRPEDGALFTLENTQIFDVDLEWLGVGMVRCGFNIDGETYFAHEFCNAGFEITTYMKTASLPMRYEITNITGVNTGSLLQICQGLHVEGGSQLWGYPQVASTELVAVSAPANVWTGVLAVRPKSTFYGYENRSTIIPVSYQMTISSNGICYSQMIHGASITGKTWTQVDSDVNYASASEYTTAITAAQYTGGHIHKKEYLSASNKGEIQSGADFIQNLYVNRGYNYLDDASSETYMMAVYPIGNAATIYGSIEIAEVY